MSLCSDTRSISHPLEIGARPHVGVPHGHSSSRSLAAAAPAGARARVSLRARLLTGDLHDAGRRRDVSADFRRRPARRCWRRLDSPCRPSPAGRAVSPATSGKASPRLSAVVAQRVAAGAQSRDVDQAAQLAGPPNVIRAPTPDDGARLQAPRTTTSRGQQPSPPGLTGSHPLGRTERASDSPDSGWRRLDLDSVSSLAVKRQRRVDRG